MRIQFLFSLVVLAVLIFTLAGGVAAQDGPAAGDDGAADRRGPSPNTNYLLAAFLLIWACLWGYLASLHRGQRRLERLITRLENS